MQSHFHLSHDLVLLFDKWRGKTLAGQSIPSTNSTDIRYTRKNAQVVTNLQQTCSNAVPTTCQQDVFSLLVPSLLASCQRLVDNLLQSSTDLSQVVSTTCIRPAIQQFVNKLPQLHDTGFVSERHQFKVFSSLVCSCNFSYLKLLFNYVVLS